MNLKEKMVLNSMVLLAVSFSIPSGVSAAASEANEASANQAKSSEDWRKQPPKPASANEFKLAKTEKYKLANGLTVELLEDHRVPFTTISFGIKAGSVYNPPSQEGLSQLVTTMLSEGTEKHSSKEIAEEIDFIGGAFSAAAGPDFANVSASALSQYNERLLAALSDILRNASFPEEELKLKKTNLIQELIMSRSKPDFLGNERFAKVIFGNHPYSLVAPKPETVEKVSRKDLLDFYKKNYLPNDTVIVAVGDFKSAEMKALIEKYFGSWKSGPEAKAVEATMPHQSGRKIYLIDRPGSVQSRIKMGNVGIKKTDPDIYAMTVANQILGGAGTSRLFSNIRENKGYTYGAYSKVNPQREPGSFAAEAEVRTDVTAPALQEFIYELERIRNLQPAEKEITSTKNYLVGSFQLGLETQSGLAARLMEAELYKLPADYLETYGQKIMAVTPEDVQRVARKYIDLDNMVVTVVGDASKIEKQLEPFAPTLVFDTSGKAVTGSPRTASGN